MLNHQQTVPMGMPFRPPERPRFRSCTVEQQANGEWTARVHLTWMDGTELIGESRQPASSAGELRSAAQACLQALAQRVRDVSFELVGVKAVRAFDATVVIVSLNPAGAARTARLVGSALVSHDEELPRGAAIAVLHATNRIVARSDLPDFGLSQD